MERTVGEVRIECLIGDITEQADVEAVMNPANRWLHPGDGVAWAFDDAAPAHHEAAFATLVS
jgi:O-acetyl-ADP-ribose deacetylase